jgi:hypothetical protein
MTGNRKGLIQGENKYLENLFSGNYSQNRVGPEKSLMKSLLFSESCCFFILRGKSEKRDRFLYNFLISIWQEN